MSDSVLRLKKVILQDTVQPAGSSRMAPGFKALLEEEHAPFMDVESNPNLIFYTSDGFLQAVPLSLVRHLVFSNDQDGSDS